MTDVETLAVRQNSTCASCTVNMPLEEQSYGMKCWKCDKLYCSKCYARDHARHNMEMWEQCD